MGTDLPRLLHVEARVLGVLIEKSLTMPGSYPLSLNAVANGANQKSNRHPVTDFSESEVYVALEGLVPKGLAGRVLAAGDRVEKFRHTALERLRIDAGEAAVLAELLLRGPQAPGELRARVHRMAPTPALSDLVPRLERLVAAGLVERLAPAPGSRAERYVQLLSPDLHEVDAPAAARPATTAGSAGSDVEARVGALEREVAELRARLEELLESLGA